MITQLRNAGLNVVRMNFSHGSYEVIYKYIINKTMIINITITDTNKNKEEIIRNKCEEEIHDKTFLSRFFFLFFVGDVMANRYPF